MGCQKANGWHYLLKRFRILIPPGGWRTGNGSRRGSGTILPLQGNGKRHTPDPCISLVSEPSVGAQVYLQFATICCKSNILFFFLRRWELYIFYCACIKAHMQSLVKELPRKFRRTFKNLLKMTTASCEFPLLLGSMFIHVSCPVQLMQTYSSLEKKYTTNQWFPTCKDRRNDSQCTVNRGCWHSILGWMSVPSHVQVVLLNLA